MDPSPSGPMSNQKSYPQRGLGGRPEPTPAGISLACLVRLGLVVLAVLAGIDLLRASQPVLGSAVVAVALAELPVIWGLWRLRRWAWKAAFVLYAAFVAVSLLRGADVPAGVTVVVALYIYTQSERYRLAAEFRGPR